MNINQIENCKSLDELASLWLSQTDVLSRLPKDETKVLIAAKDSHKGKLELFEEWSYWHNERAAIAEYDGGVSRNDAESMAFNAIRDNALIKGGGAHNGQAAK